MSAEEIYAAMFEGEQKRVSLVDAEGDEYTGFVDVFESRYDNEDDEPPFSGQGSICFFPDDAPPMLLYESVIKSIKVLE